MNSLFLRIWLTVIAVLAVFAVGTVVLFQRQAAQERQRVEVAIAERLAPWAELIQRSLPPADAPAPEQGQALREWSQRLRVPLALQDARGQRIAASDMFARLEAESPGRRYVTVPLDDGRSLQVMRAGLMARMLPPGGDGPAARGFGGGGPGGRPGPGIGPGMGTGGAPPQRPPDPIAPFLGLPPGTGFLILLALLFVAMAAAAYPVVRGITRRLESLRQGVEAFGAGALDRRVPVQGRDEVAALARSFNHSAERVQALLRAHQSLLANASHELRSPLARLKMAVALHADAAAGQRERLKREIDANVAELDALVEEVLLASRLDAAQAPPAREPVDLAGLAAEEAARVGAEIDADPALPALRGDERLLRRALRNLLENARRYGGGEVAVALSRSVSPASGRPIGAELQVCDRGPGVPEAFRERIFEPFFRLPGHAEREGGVGLGLSLVRQIAQAHGGQVRCEARAGGGSCFVLSLPAAEAEGFSPPPSAAAPRP